MGARDGRSSPNECVLRRVRPQGQENAPLNSSSEARARYTCSLDHNGYVEEFSSPPIPCVGAVELSCVARRYVKVQIRHPKDKNLWAEFF